MKRFLLTFILILPAIFSLCAQNAEKGHKGKHPSAKEVNEFKMKFLAQEMELDADQQQKFIELYTKMSDERFSRFKNVKELEKKVKSDKNASEADYAALSDAIGKSKIDDAEMEKRYDELFSRFLTSKQIFKMKEGEEKFRRKMREMKRDRKKQER